MTDVELKAEWDAKVEAIQSEAAEQFAAIDREYAAAMLEIDAAKVRHRPIEVACFVGMWFASMVLAVWLVSLVR